MASKHAALYFEAYKQHHLVCPSLHTLSREVSRVQGRLVVMGESPRQARQANLKRRECANGRTRKPQNDTRHETEIAPDVYRSNSLFPCCTILQVLAPSKTTGTGHHQWL